MESCGPQKGVKVNCLKNPILRTGFFRTLKILVHQEGGPSVFRKKCMESLESLGNVCICIYIYKTIRVYLYNILYIYGMYE